MWFGDSLWNLYISYFAYWYSHDHFWYKRMDEIKKLTDPKNYEKFDKKIVDK